MTLDETVESYIGLVDMFFKQFLIYPYHRNSSGKPQKSYPVGGTPPVVQLQRVYFNQEVSETDSNVKKLFVKIGDVISEMAYRGELWTLVEWNIKLDKNFDSKFREYCLLQMQKYHSNRDEAMYTVSKLDEFTPFSYEVVGEEPNCKHILKYLKTGGIIEPIKR